MIGPSSVLHICFTTIKSFPLQQIILSIYTYIFNVLLVQKGEISKLLYLVSVYIHFLMSRPDGDPNLGSKSDAT